MDRDSPLASQFLRPPVAPIEPAAPAGPPSFAGPRLRPLSDAFRPVPPPPLPRPDPPDERLIRRLVPGFRLLSRYGRLHVEGLPGLPKGPAVLVANHTGCLGFDYAYAAVALRDHDGRILRGLVHDAWFRHPPIARLARRLGFARPSQESLVALLQAGETVMVFPEGEAAAFKPGLHGPRYRLQQFRRGFVRAAMITGAPIVPVAIVGGEEANPVLRTFASARKRLGLPLPLPLTLFPLPVKWRMRFLPPIWLEGHGRAGAADTPLVHSVAADVRRRLQVALDREVRDRGNPV